MKLAVTGNTEAQYQLAIAYLTGRHAPLSLSHGVRWLESAAMANHDHAREVLEELKAAVFKAIAESEKVRGGTETEDRA